MGFIILINSKFFFGFSSDVTNLSRVLFNGIALLFEDSPYNL